MKKKKEKSSKKSIKSSADRKIRERLKALGYNCSLYKIEFFAYLKRFNKFKQNIVRKRLLYLSLN